MPPLVLYAAIVGLVIPILGCSKQVRDSDIRYVSLPEVRQRQLDVEDGRSSRVLIIDPRSTARYGRGHIPSAINFGLADAPEEGPTDARLEGFDRLVVYGDNPASAVAKAMAKRLIALGYGRDRVRWFSGGLAEWARAGLPVDVVEDEPSDD
ncbi:MAG: rhodanese-like domain-containing protein [Planctomycetota bacterium]